METSLPSQQGLRLLLEEMTYCLGRMDQHQQAATLFLGKLSSAFNLKNQQASFTPDSTAALEGLRTSFQDYMLALLQAEAAYQDLSGQMKDLLAGRSAPDPLFQEIARQGSLLLKDLQKRQEWARCFAELSQVIDKAWQQERLGAPLKQKIEDLVFRLQLLF